MPNENNVNATILPDKLIFSSTSTVSDNFDEAVKYYPETRYNKQLTFGNTILTQTKDASHRYKYSYTVGYKGNQMGQIDFCQHGFSWKDRIKFTVNNLVYSNNTQQYLECKQPNISAIEKFGKDLTDEQLEILNSKYGVENVFKYVEIDEKQPVQFYDPEFLPNNKRLIPLWDDVSSVGGHLRGERSALIEPNSLPAEWIDPGDWFKSATAAIRHYGDSMVEYQPGCILALKEVQDRRLIIPGIHCYKFKKINCTKIGVSDKCR